MSYYENALKMRPYIEQAVASLSDKDALEVKPLFSAWSEEKSYQAGDRVYYNKQLYKCLQPHTAQPSWAPDAALSLWAEVLIPNPDVTPEWKQPDSTNPYSKGDKVQHNGKTWVSTVDTNVWEPGVYGWNEVI